MTSTNHMHRASAPGSGSLDLSLAGRRASRRTRSQRVAVVVAHVPPALLRSSSMEVLERPSAQDPAKSGHECLTRGTATMSRSRAHTHTRRWNPLRGCAGRMKIADKEQALLPTANQRADTQTRSTCDVSQSLTTLLPTEHMVHIYPLGLR